jgi:hypothetical protein
MRVVFAGILLACAAWAQEGVSATPLPQSGQSVTAAYEGWFKNPDGTYSILFGYFNRNTMEEPDIPIGPLNRIEPGGPDRGQPTHFLPRRQWGVFTITVPSTFGPNDRLTWTIVANGQQTQVPAKLDPLWEVEPFRDATNNTPPYIGFAPEGPFVNGPAGPSRSMTAAVGEPLTLEVWVSDDANVIPGATQPRTPAVTLGWSKFRGPGEVKFANARPAVQPAEFAAPGRAVFKGKASTTVTFGAPGEYVLRLVANDWSGDGGRGFQCCWSNAQVKVSVK